MNTESAVSEKCSNTRKAIPEEERERIKALALKGLGINEIARQVKRSAASVSRIVKTLRASGIMAITRANRIADQKLDAAEQLKKINKKANQILDSTDPKSPDIVLKAMAEIRGQLKLQLEIFQALYNVEEVAKWQNELMEILGEIAPDARDRFYQRLRERRPI